MSQDSMRGHVLFRITLKLVMISKKCRMQRRALAVTLGPERSTAALGARTRGQRYDIRFSGPATAVWWKEAIRESKVLLSG